MLYFPDSKGSTLTGCYTSVGYTIDWLGLSEMEA